MDFGRSRSAKSLPLTLLAATACLFAAACSTSSETAASFALTNPAAEASQPSAGAADDGIVPLARSEEEHQAASGKALPETVAYLPKAKPGDAADDAAVAAAAEAQDKTAAAGGDAQAAAAEETQPGHALTAASPAPKKGLLTSLFSTSQAAAAPAPRETAEPRPLIAQEKKPAPLVKLASAETGEEPLARHSTGSYGSDALPGVRQTALFEIRRKSGIDDESDVDLNEEDGVGPIRVASAAGMARLAPNGLLRQTDHVDTACLKPGLVSALRQIERHFGRKLIITSGYRSPTYNRQVRGAKKSQHMYCAAADIQVPGVSKWELAAYARSLPGRGGVGTYCHTESVHFDIGPERDWNWRCRRRKA